MPLCTLAAPLSRGSRASRLTTPRAPVAVTVAGALAVYGRFSTAMGEGRKGNSHRSPLRVNRMADRRRPGQRPVAMAPQVAAESEQRQWLRGIRFSGFTVVMLGIVVLSVIVLAPGLRTVVEQQQQIAALKESVRQKQQAVNDLKLNIDRWKDPAYVEAQARNRLLYMFPGDISYLVIDDGATPTDDAQAVSDQIQPTQIDWTRSLLSSVITAGTTTKTAEELAP